MVYLVTFVRWISIHGALEGICCIVEPFHLIHKTELTTQEKWQDGKDGLYRQQKQAMMSSAEKDTLAMPKECLWLHQPPQQRKMPEQKEHIYNRS